ncbi:2-oxoglutarate-dependent dioxygenase 21, chloroplastic-like [Phragmites australis]|uniref:2-oxoglutarate-dependent dioxygenase 21, chloroplastic-like n=1 Tax=Phragmites australis TaxID=29695 RepID=UPI002D776404|nr:2-oxoglutarate-dependent dioxygenase 21, chloroplastic-like [Phragmites australis]
MQDLGRVCQNRGFSQLINHGICTDILNDAPDADAAFFDMPMGDRSGLESDDVTRPDRYSTVSEVNNGEVRIRRHVLKQYSYPLEEWIDKWPAQPSQYSGSSHSFRREKMAKYATEARRLVSELVEAITESLGLGLSRGDLRTQMERGFEMMAVNCYPPPGTSSDLPTRVSIASLPSLAVDERFEVAKQLVDVRHAGMYRGSSLKEFVEFLPAGG